MEYFSQYGQDKYLNEEIFKGKEYGFFVDIGANDGITYSNSLFFEKYKNWSGICIEPMPNEFNTLKETRNCIAYNIAVSDVEGTMDFLLVDGYSSMLSGLLDTQDPKHLERIDKEISMHGGKKEVVKIDTKRLDSIFDKENIKKVDFCSLDIEGGELPVLKSIDFTKVQIDCFVIENNYLDVSVSNFLKKHGYIAIKLLKTDMIYLHKNCNLKSSFYKNIASFYTDFRFKRKKARKASRKNNND